MESLHLLSRIARFLPIVLWQIVVGLLSWFVPRSLYAKSVDQEVVLITGAGSGLGRQIALRYAKLKSTLILWDINAAGLAETKLLVEAQYAKTLKPTDERRDCFTYIVDVSSRARIQEAAKQVKIELNSAKLDTKLEAVNRGQLEQDELVGKQQQQQESAAAERYVSVLVNNAGIYYGQYLHDLSDQQIERIFNINILAHFWTVRAFLPDMIKHERGHIVEIASMGGMVGMFKQVDYCATKFATVGFEQSLSIELDHLGLGDKIRTTVVCPLFFNSNLFSNFNDRAGGSLMSAEYVADEAVLTMRCNHAQVFLPRLTAYPLVLVRDFCTRTLVIESTKLTIAHGVKDIVGHAK